MPLQQRVLRVTISLPSGDVVLDESLALRVTIHKAALAIQNTANIEVMGMSTSLRLKLLSQFTAWHKRQVSTGQVPQDWISIKVEAGYSGGNGNQGGASQPATIFIGQVVTCDPISAPPNIGIRICCFTRQIDKTAYLTQMAPTNTTYYNLVAFAAQQMGFGSNFTCQTSYNDKIVTNAFRTIYTQGQLLIGIQDLYRPNAVAFVDDDRLIVKDRNKIINPADIPQVTEFIGTPEWNEWGVSWQSLMDPSIKLAGGATLTSLMNPGINGKYVIYELQYQLTSRDEPFYLKATAGVPA